MDKKRKNYSSFSKRHFRRIIANNTVSDILKISSFSNNEHFESGVDEILPNISENLELLENEFVNKNDELVDDLIESDTDIKSNEEEKHSSESSDINDDASSHELTEESVTQYMKNVEPDNEMNNRSDEIIKDIASCVWAIMFNIFHVALMALLVILRKYTQYSFPRDPRTLLKTPRHTAVEMGVGQYCHFGLQNALKKMLDEYNKVLGQMPVSLDLFINIDGLPISKSSNSALLPILCSDTVLKFSFHCWSILWSIKTTV